ncbi:MAG: iron-containing alcohol dehydrogenase [Myxococcota bacterium]
MTVVWHFPNRILFGESVAAETGAETARLGGHRALVVTDSGVVDAGLVDDVEKSLRRSKIGFEVFTGVSSNPRADEAVAAAEAFRQAQADLVVAVGGGSAIDVGKLVRILASHPGPLGQYAEAVGGDEKITEPMPPMIALPTTAGTGSEVGRSAVATMEDTGRKTVFFHPRLIPDVAILDPTLTTTMSPRTTAATGFDALTHCIEAYCAQGDHPMADAIAFEGVALVARNLPKAVENGEDLQARGAMLKAAMMGAVAFQKGLGACHSLAHPLSAELGLHHGLANALCLPAVLDFNRSAVPRKISRVARRLGARGDDTETLAFECSGSVRALRRKVGLPEGLEEAGVSEDVLPRLAALAVEDGSHALNPRPCSKDDMLALYKASM